MKNWNGFSLILICGLMSLILPLCLAGAAKLFAYKKENTADLNEPPQSGDQEQIFARRINIRFFLGANLLLLFFSGLILLVPLVFFFNDSKTQSSAGAGIIILCFLNVLGLIYSVRKGDLDWLRTFRTMKDIELDEKNSQENGLGK